MHKVFTAILTAAAVIGCTLSAHAEWITIPIDITCGAAAPTTAVATAGAFPQQASTLTAGAVAPATASWSTLPTTNTAARIATNYTAAVATYLRSITPGTILGGGSIVVSRVTNGVPVTLATFTNGAAAYSTGLWLAATDLITATSTNATNTVTLTASLQTNSTASAAITSRSQLITATPGTILGGGSIVLARVTNSVSVTLATFTNGGAAFSTLTAIPLDATLTLTPSGVTNLATVALTLQPVAPATWTAAFPGYIRSITPGTILPAATVLTTTITTSSVAAVTLSLTNGAAAWSTGIFIAAGDTVTLDTTTVTNRAAATIAYQYASTATLSPESALPGDAIKITSLTLLGTNAPDTGSMALAIARRGQASSAIATFTNGCAAYAPTTALLILPGDTLTLTPTGLTNAPALRAVADRQIPIR